MSFIDEAVKKLKEIGWSEYESKTYSALVSLGRTTASQIAKVSQVPPNRVYQILDKLKEKHIVEDVQPTRGGPRIFRPKDPHVLFNDLKIEYNTKIDQAQNELEKLKERVDEKPSLSTFTIIGRKELNNYLQKLTKHSNNNIMLAVDTLVELKYSNLIDILKEKHRTEGFELKLLTMPRGIDNVYEEEIIDELDPCKVHISDTPFGTILLVVDEETSIFINYGIHDDIKLQLNADLPSDQLDALYLDREKNYVGFYVHDKNIAQMYAKLFSIAWEESILYSEYIRDKSPSD